MASLNRPSEASGAAPGGIWRPQAVLAIEPVGRQLLQASEASCALVRSPGSQQIGQEQRPAAKRISPRRAEPQLCNSLGSRR